MPIASMKFTSQLGKVDNNGWRNATDVADGYYVTTELAVFADSSDWRRDCDRGKVWNVDNGEDLSVPFNATFFYCKKDVGP